MSPVHKRRSVKCATLIELGAQVSDVGESYWFRERQNGIPGLRGEVREEQFQRLSEGQHPVSGERLIRHQSAREYMNRRGEKVSAMEHRAGWDATFGSEERIVDRPRGWR